MLDPTPARRAPQTGREIEDMKPGQPPRPATEPDDARGSSKNHKTKTDPATGAPQEGDSQTHGAG